ncbi:transposase [Noviherbaspirillum sp. DKR-6]|uniref:Transposase n=1 Tax=Noviherbaspirillum pedocola TaxID=2801341 RepID=A0A934T0R4_9BURK|nr:transposase [Noviherbaspirillum pedocola]
MAIKEVHRLSRETYGVRRMQPELAAQGFLAGRDRIGRLRGTSKNPGESGKMWAPQA